MTESLITISVVGLFAGLIFSMPIAGPISILITTNALKGRSRYSNRVNIGASFATFTYVFVAVYGLTKLYTFYKPAIPYLFSLSSLFLLFIGYKIFRTKIDIEHIEDKNLLSEIIKKKEKGGFYTGFILNFLNPTLIIGWLTSTFLVISFVSSFGFNTGGLDIFIGQSVKEISSMESSVAENIKAISSNNTEIIKIQANKNTHEKQADLPKHFHLLISLLYAFFISAGSIIWFYSLVFLLTRFRKIINVKIISVFVKSLSVILCLFGLYFGFLAAQLLFDIKI